MDWPRGLDELFFLHSGGVSSPLQGVTVPCDTAIYVDTALKAVAERYIVLGWTSSMIGGPLLMGANQSSWTGLFYKASEFAWANFVHLEEFVFLFIKASACRVSCISGQWME